MADNPRDDRQEGERRKKPRGGVPAIFTFLLILVGLIVLVDAFGSGRSKDVSYNEFLRRLYTGQIVEATTHGTDRVQGKFFSETDEQQTPFSCNLPPGVLEGLNEDLRAFVNVTPTVKTEIDILRELENGVIVPVRAWSVPMADQDVFFLDYYTQGSRRQQRAQIDSNSSTGVDFGRLQQGLNAHDLTIERKYIAGSPVGEQGESLNHEQDNKLLVGLFWNIVPWLLILGLFWFFIFRQMRSPGGAGGVLSFGRAKASLVTKDRTGVTFADVAGAEEAKEEVSEVVEFLKDPSRFVKVGARIPRGVLLVGSPGTGKTLLARAIAGEADVPFFSISGSDFVEMFVGVGASRVRDLFRQAREKSPCIVFLDEIDAVGRRRGSGLGGGHDEREQTLNAILVEMDGFDTDEGIILIAATNRPDVLDPALLRPGRFDRQIVIDLPDVKGREAILQVHTRQIKLEPSVELSVVARGTPGFSGAELANLVNEAALQTALAGREKLSMADLEEARDRVRFGREKAARVMDPKDSRLTAYHEAGHALVGAMHEGVEPLHKVTIIPRGMALGATMVLPTKDKYSQTRNEMLGMICFAYGGRLAEEIFCNDVTSGAYDDIKKATNVARMMVTQWGMSPELGPVNFAERDDSIFLGNEVVKHRNYSEETARKIDMEVQKILESCYEQARKLIEENKGKLESIAQALLKYETIHGEEIDEILVGVPIEEARANFERKHAPPTPAKTVSATTPAESDSKRKPYAEPEGDLPPAGEPAVS